MRQIQLLLIAFCAVCILAPPTCAQTAPTVELGQVQWLRNIEVAEQQSRSSGKPILLLFQEIPGCETCRNFGNRPLSHPLLVEAIEDLFVPLAIHNNKKGVDEKILLEFKEPSWNNPVIRYINADRTDIIPRKDRVWTVGGTAQRMIEALQKAGRDIPGYLQLVSEESNSKTNTATVAMHCYWEGEGQLGGVDGVLDTKSAWVGEKEVVDITFAPSRVDYETLLKKAKNLKCASTIFAHDEAQQKVASAVDADHTQLIADGGNYRIAKDSDQKYYLRQTLMRLLPLTPLQSTKVNAALHAKQDVMNLLSPRQVQMLRRIEKANQQNPKALESLSYPDSVERLASYQSALLKTLDSVAK